MFYFIALAPLMADNYIFSRSITPGFAMFYSGAPVVMEPLTLSSAWRQAVELYFSWCGRFTGNLAVFLLFLLPRWLYALLAAAAYGLYLVLLLICVFGRAWRRKISASWVYAIAALLWAGIPSYGEAFFWLSVGGQIALLGQAAIFVPFRLALDRPFASQGLPKTALACAGLFLSGLAVAMLDYPTSAALPPVSLACAAFVWLRGGRKTFPWLLLACSLGLCIGAIATLGSPGNSCRLALTTDDAVIAYMRATWPARIQNWLLQLPGAALLQFVPLVFLLWTCIRLFRIQGRAFLAKIPVSAWLFLVPAALTHCAYLFTDWPPARAFATTSAQLIISACVIFASLPDSARTTVFRLLRALLCVFCVCSIVYEAGQFWTLSREAEARHRILASARESAAVPPFSVKPDGHQPLGNNLADIAPDPEFWINRAVASWHGLKSVRLLPKADIDGEFAFQGSPDSLPLRISARNGRLALAGQSGEYHIYYHGAPGLLALLPNGPARAIADWLAEAKSGDWRLSLVPLFMARLDLDVRDGSARSGQLKLESGRRLWLARPGSPWWSSDIIPLASSGDASPGAD